jgi:hypothetical protein
MKYLLTAVLGLFALGCSQAYQPKEITVMNLHLGDSTYAELVDFLYEYAGKHRLTVQWFGWYEVDNAQNWYERSNEKSNFKIKLQLLTEENGSLFFTSYFDKSIASLSVDYGDRKPEWLVIVAGFEKEIEAKGWRSEHVKTNVFD